MCHQVEQYIRENWKNTIRAANKGGGILIELPKPYTSPCINEKFLELYYWDTYFTNVGLILSGMVIQAKNNVDNMFYLINTYGKMPNGNTTHYLDRSQPPFLSLMVRDIYDATEDIDWLRNEAYPALMKEYHFWQEKRNTPVGLNRYYADVRHEERLLKYAQMLCNRIGQSLPDDKDICLELGRSMFSLAESGWDCTSRFAFDAHKHIPIDLNSLLYMMEINMAYFAKKIGKIDDISLWSNRAEKRKEKINHLLWSDERNVFCDLNFETGKLNDVVSVAAFYPLFAGLATAKQAEKTLHSLSLLEHEHGIVCCENRDDLLGLQWDYPHGWACLQYITIKGLINYGHKEDALRIAQKYMNTATANFETTHNLWEKYNVVTGKVSVSQEYATPPMMGWSAGVFQYCNQLLNSSL